MTSGATQLPLGLTSHNNQSLFSDHYLDDILRRTDNLLKERREWELFLADAQQQHQQLTSQIITLETELNQQVYALFHLTQAEIQIIETSTKYNYGEV
jgi:hypothetical protein